MKYFFSFSLLLIIGIGAVRAQTDSNSVVIDIRDSQTAKASGYYLNGFARAIGGTTISYHSVHPDAEEALLVRSNSEAPSISWQTDTLPTAFPGTAYRFVWLAGIERSGWGNAVTPHQFRFSINGKEAFVFTNRKDSTAAKWTMTGEGGAGLTFESSMADKYGDLFGYMYLNLPKEKYPTGAPLTIRIDGENAGSPEWYMAFKYSFNFIPNLRVEPALVRNRDERSHLLRMSLDNLFPGRSVQVNMAGTPVVQESLKLGANIFLLPFSSSDKQKDVGVTCTLNGKNVAQRSLALTPVRQRSIYLIPHTHNDIGYTDLQPEVERKQWRYLDQAMELIRKTKDYPAQSRYKWNLEILWPLESWLRNASTEKKEEFLADVRAGSIGVNALLANPLTGLATAVEMSHFTDFAREFSKTYSIPITTAAISDIPGFTWGIVPALAQSGVKYFASGPNNGDRIGYVIEQWGDKPFYWASQSDSEKVLFWVAGSGYASFHQATLPNSGPERVMKLIRKLDDTGYPYEMYFLPYTLGDNAGNDSTLPDFVRAWNEKYISPRLVIATHAELFNDFEKQYGSTLPVVKGDFTPYWEDGAASTAYETALSRKASDRIVQAEAIWSNRAPGKFSDSLSRAAWRDVSLWDEHTWGADISVSEPDAPKSTGQWIYKQRFALEADSLSKALLSGALEEPDAGTPTVDIWNTCSWTRSNVAYLTKAQSATGDLVTEMGGKSLASQRLSTGELAVFIKDVPAIGTKRIRIGRGKSTRPSRVKISGSSMENSFVSLSIDQRTGAIKSLRRKSDGAEIVDGSADLGINQYFYVPGINPDSSGGLKNVKVTVEESGPLVATLRISGDAPGCKSYSYTVSLIDGIDRIDICNFIDKEKVRDKEAVHFAFPFNVKNGALRYDVASGIVRPETDQLEGACKNFFSVASWVDISNDSDGITWTTPDAPLIEIGAINAEKPWMKSISPSSTFYSYTMNNYWHTNYKADQEGPVSFSYSIFPHRAFSAESAARLGIESRSKLIAASVNPKAPLAKQLFAVSPSSVLVTSVRPIDDGAAWLLSFYNPTAATPDISIRWRRDFSNTAFWSDAFGNQLAQLKVGSRIGAFGTGYILVKKR